MEDIKQQLEKLRVTLGKMEVALNSVSNAIVWTNSQGKIQWCNALFEDLVERKKILLIGTLLEKNSIYFEINKKFCPQHIPLILFCSGGKKVVGFMNSIKKR